MKQYSFGDAPLLIRIAGRIAFREHREGQSQNRQNQISAVRLLNSSNLSQPVLAGAYASRWAYASLPAVL